MTRTRLLGIATVCLVLSNLMLAVFIVLGPSPQQRHRQPRQVIIERLHFDDRQIAAYEPLIHWHRSNITRLEAQMGVLRNQLYNGLNQPSNTKKDSLIAGIAVLQQEIEYVHYRHFGDIRKLCRPDQLADYERLTHEIAGLFAPPPPPSRKR